MNTTQTDMPTTSLEPDVHDDRGEGAEQLQFVTFEVENEEFAIDILAVQEIIRMMQITRVPQSPASVEGVINLRGQITPVCDLRKRFDLAPSELNNESRIIVVEVKERVLGFIVDRVHEVLRVDSSIVQPAPDLATSVDSDYVRGVGKLDDRILILLDLERLFAAADLDEVDQCLDQAA